MSDKDIKKWDARLKDQNDRGWENYLHRRILLDVAADLQDWAIAGEFIYIEKVSSAAAVASIRLNRNTNDPIDLELGTTIKTIFTEVFITHAALAGEWIDIIWGINFEYYKQLASPVTVVDGGGSLSVDDGGGSLTVDGIVAVSAVAGVVQVADNGGSLSVDGTFWQATQPVSAAALPLPAGAATAALQTQPGVDVGDVTVNNGAGAAAVNVQDGGNAITVDLAAAQTLANVTTLGTITNVVHVDDNAGALTVDGSVTAANTAGDVAHDAADSGNPVKTGGKAVNMDGTAPGTAVAENDRANCITDLYGRQCVETVHPNFWSAAVNYATAQTAVELKAAPGAGLSLYITDVVASNGATVGNMKFGEDTAALVDKIEVMYFAVNGGAALHFRTPIKLTANKNFGLTSVSCTTHSVTVNGYTAP